MKHLMAVLLCLFLWGCTRQPSPIPTETLPESTAIAAMAGLYDPDHPLKKSHPGLVRAYPITLQNVYGILPLEKNILVLSGQSRTTMTVFTGEDLYETASLTLDFLLQQEDPSLQIHKNGISYFDPERQETVVLDSGLREIRRIAVPKEISGKPILSSDADTLYYCTGWSIVAWNLESGIRRTVKELIYEGQELTALHLEDQILECRITDNGSTRKLLLSADQGLEIHTLPEDALLHTSDSCYFAALPSGYQTLLIFGNTESSPEFLLPEKNWQQQFYLPEDHAVVTVCTSGEDTQLNYYALSTGILRASVTMKGFQAPKTIINEKDLAVYILAYDSAADCDVIFRWDPLHQSPDPSNTTAYTAEYHSQEAPDVQTLEECRKYAEEIGQKYGITILLWEDALVLQPWDYRFEAEHLAPILKKELNLLDQRLAQYPQDMLQQTIAHFSGLTLCLVRSIGGTGADGSLSTATGIQFFEENEAYVVITTGKHSEQALYHELYHVMETHILTESIALDQWESLNPAGFAYGSYQEDNDIYLQGQTRAFVDRYSMISSKEDRARVLENAMLQGKQEIFQTEYMQRKLKALCVGIREAYGLKKYPESLPWEQYLVNSLTP